MGGPMKHLVGFLFCATLIAGCSEGAFAVKNRNPVFDGYTFRSSAKPVTKRGRQEFVVTVRNASRSAKGAGLAAEHEAIRYCIKYFGTSDIIWPIDPTEDGVSLPVQDNVLRLSAECRD